jgi:hypothetical protein
MLQLFKRVEILGQVRRGNRRESTSMKGHYHFEPVPDIAQLFIQTVHICYIGDALFAFSV